MLSIINILTLQKKTRPVIVPQKARRVGQKQGPASSQLISNPLNSLNSITTLCCSGLTWFHIIFKLVIISSKKSFSYFGSTFDQLYCRLLFLFQLRNFGLSTTFPRKTPLCDVIWQTIGRLFTAPRTAPNDVCAKRPGRLKFVYQIVYQNACLVVDVTNLAQAPF